MKSMLNKRNISIYCYNLFFIILFFFSLIGCTSTKKFNAHLSKEIPVKELQSDIDYVHKKLKRYHPKLDMYESQKDIDYQFDSLRKTINEPLKPNEFFLKLYPVLGNLRHGHTKVFPSFHILDKRERRKYKGSTSAFKEFQFLFQNDSIILIKDSSNNNPVNSGSKLIAINNLSISDLISKYKPALYGDGFNKTHEDNLFGRYFLNYSSLELGIKDSLKLTFLDKGDSIIKTVHRKFSPNKRIKNSLNSSEKALPKTVQKPTDQKQTKRIYGYNKLTKKYSKRLIFPRKDSTIALLKIVDFRRGIPRKLYKEVFTEIKKHNVKNLIIDLRNNGGGHIKDAHLLFAYLEKDSSPFQGEKIVKNRTAFGKSLYNLFPLPSYPFLWIGSTYSYFATSKNEKNEYVLNLPFSSAKVDSKLIYTGNLYVIINGGTYSAATLIAANLDKNKRAFFVGEETGGDYNGTVAGLMPKFRLPNSKLKMSIGTVYISTPKQRSEIGHGVYADKEIKQTLEMRSRKEDPELIWIFKDIENGNIALKKNLTSLIP